LVLDFLQKKEARDMKAKVVARQLLIGGLDASDIEYYLLIEELNNLAIQVDLRGVVQVSEMFSLISKSNDQRTVLREVDVPDELVKTAAGLVCHRAKMSGYLGLIKDLVSNRPKVKLHTEVIGGQDK
jgi:hypothetical protein